jgi:hypothetical protein
MYVAPYERSFELRTRKQERTRAYAATRTRVWPFVLDPSYIEHPTVVKAVQKH